MADATHTWPIDIETLLVPIAPNHPAGDSLRYDVMYDRIKEARRADDPNLPQGVWETDLKRADWQAVSDLCIEALTTRTKDLQIAAWLLEAWVHLHGIEGVRVGLELLAGLCRGFWYTLYPEQQGGNIEARIAPIRWMNDHLSRTLSQIEITQPQTNNSRPYRWLDWENALYMDKLVVKDPSLLKKAEAEQRVTKTQFQESVMLSPTPFYADTLKKLDSTLEALADLAMCLTQQCGDQAPSLEQFKGVLTNIRRFVTRTLTERTTVEVVMTTDLHEAREGGMYIAGSTPIRSRAEAYQQLAAIADYLTRVEPHSPTPYLIKRAVTWGGMSLTELLLELVGNQSDLQAIYTLLGIKQGGDT